MYRENFRAATRHNSSCCDLLILWKEILNDNFDLYNKTTLLYIDSCIYIAGQISIYHLHKIKMGDFLHLRKIIYSFGYVREREFYWRISH